MTQSGSHEWLGVVRAGAWFASLPQNLADELIAEARHFRVDRGARLFARGEPGDGIYCVLRGSVRITGVTENGHEAVLALLESSQWFGEIALFDRAPRTHDAWIEREAELLHVPQRALERILEEYPHLWREFGRLLTQKIRVLFSVVEATSILPPTALVANHLAIMAEGMGSGGGASKRMVNVSQEKLGLMLSLSRQTINQVLKKLESDGAIQRRRGAIEILDLDKLLVVMQADNE